MVVGGAGPQAFQDVEVLSLESKNTKCAKPDNSTVGSGSFGAFMDHGSVVCGGWFPAHNATVLHI